MKKAIFLDRDWTINIDNWYTFKVKELKIIDNNIWNILKKFKDLGYLLIIVTNQSWIDRWYYSENDFWKFMNAMEKELNIKFDGIYFCPSHPDFSWNSKFRKPNNWMLLKANEDFWIDFNKSFMIWDSISDMIAWKTSWCKTILLWKKESWNKYIDFYSDSWEKIEKIILEYN